MLYKSFKDLKEFDLTFLIDRRPNEINHNEIKLEKNGCYMFLYIITLVLSLCKFIRILFQVGDFYFSIILFGLYLETTTLLIRPSSKFMTLGWSVLEFLLILSIFIFTNIISILPLTLQFW